MMIFENHQLYYFGSELSLELSLNPKSFSQFRKLINEGYLGLGNYERKIFKNEKIFIKPLRRARRRTNAKKRNAAQDEEITLKNKFQISGVDTP